MKYETEIDKLRRKLVLLESHDQARAFAQDPMVERILETGEPDDIRTVQSMLESLMLRFPMRTRS